MGLVIKLIAVWGLCDALFLGTRPKAWAAFWRKGVEVAGASRPVSIGLAALQLVICLALIKGKR